LWLWQRLEAAFFTVSSFKLKIRGRNELERRPGYRRLDDQSSVVIVDELAGSRALRTTCRR